MSFNSDEIDIYVEGDFRLYELTTNHSINLVRRQYDKLTSWVYLGSADIERHGLSDEDKVQKQLSGDRYRIMVIKLYDPETDSDAEVVGGLCSKDEAIQRLWERRHSL
jgi:hypothetical protein